MQGCCGAEIGAREGILSRAPGLTSREILDVSKTYAADTYLKFDKPSKVYK